MIPENEFCSLCNPMEGGAILYTKCNETGEWPDFMYLKYIEDNQIVRRVTMTMSTQWCVLFIQAIIIYDVLFLFNGVYFIGAHFASCEKHVNAT
jgi:hypothetical protein